MQEHEPPAAPTYTDQQVAKAKENVCAAFGQVDRALSVAADLAGSNDPTAVLAVATSTRQVLDFGNRYLLSKLSAEPATPSDLATAVRKQADAYQELLIGYLDGQHYGDSALQPAADASVDATNTIKRLCK
jgi:ABC-type transporter Mla subunit MlaD